jgi:hypothetical protein
MLASFEELGVILEEKAGVAQNVRLMDVGAVVREPRMPFGTVAVPC